MQNARNSHPNIVAPDRVIPGGAEAEKTKRGDFQTRDGRARCSNCRSMVTREDAADDRAASRHYSALPFGASGQSWLVSRAAQSFYVDRSRKCASGAIKAAQILLPADCRVDRAIVLARSAIKPGIPQRIPIRQGSKGERIRSLGLFRRFMRVRKKDEFIWALAQLEFHPSFTESQPAC